MDGGFCQLRYANGRFASSSTLLARINTAASMHEANCAAKKLKCARCKNRKANPQRVIRVASGTTSILAKTAIRLTALK